MADNLTRIATADWRAVVRRNNHKTLMVILLFICIYTAIGLLIDVYLQASHYPQADFQSILTALVTFKLFPSATCIMLGISVLALFVSFMLHDQLMLAGTDYQEVAPNASNPTERQLYNIIEELKIAAGLAYMPKVYIINAPYMNAFASGYSEKSAMVAITAGLLAKLSRDELQAVMAHELSHIRHLDIKVTLTASLLANLSIMALDMLFYNMIFSSRRDDGEGRGRNNLFIIIIVLRYVLPILSMLLLLYLSRSRELMADAGCVELMRTGDPLAHALLKINQDYTDNQSQYAALIQSTPHENVRREAYLFDPTQAGIASITSISDLFSTHPSLGSRLAALGFKQRG